MSLKDWLTREQSHAHFAPRLRTESGAAFSEFVIVFPILFFIFLTFIDFGRFYYYRGLATASAQRGVSLGQVISGLEEVDPDDANDAVLLAIKSRAMELIHNRMGVPVTDDYAAMISILPEDTNRPLVILPEVDPGETLEEVLEREPIEVSFWLRMRPISPWLSPMTVVVQALGYQEGDVQSSVPVPANCNGESIDDFGVVDPNDCRCPGAPTDPTVWDPISNTCICAEGAAGEGVCECPTPQIWNPDIGACTCPDCPDSVNQTAGDDCECTCPGSTSLNPDSGICQCLFGLEQTDAGQCICPASLAEECDGVLGFNPDGATIEEICPCTECEALEHEENNVCVCDPLDTIPDCPTGGVQNAETCACECPDGFLEGEVDGSPACICDAEELLLSGACDPNQVVNNETCVCEDYCANNETVFDNGDSYICCVNPQVFAAGECSCPEGSTVDTINGGAGCGNLQQFDESTCSCKDCPPNQVTNPADPLSCSCPAESGDVTFLCPDDGQVYNDNGDGTCGCVNCTGNTPDANESNTECICEVLDSGQDLSTACPNERYYFDVGLCLCEACPASTPDQDDAGTGCVCRALVDGVDLTEFCSASQFFDPAACRCRPCPSGTPNQADDALSCVCQVVEDGTDLTGYCGANQYFDEAACRCVGCPQGTPNQNDDGTGCYCQVIEEGTDLAGYCPDGQFFNSSLCRCTPCPTSTPNQNTAGDGCYCEVLVDGSDLTTLCPGNQFFDSTTCACKSCPTVTPNQGADGTSCVCELTDGLDGDYTSICTASNEIFNGACGCDTCPSDSATPDANPDNTACYCALSFGVDDLTTICGGDDEFFDAAACSCATCTDPANPTANPTGDGCFCPNNPATGGTNPCTGDGEIFNPANCNECGLCESAANPDANLDHTACTCLALDAVGGDRTQLCTGETEYFNPADCNNCAVCEVPGFGSNPANTGCVCIMEQSDCNTDEFLDADECQCVPCPEGRVYENGSCQCETTCNGEGGSPVGSNPNESCTCLCPDGFGVDEGLFGNRCVDERCLNDATAGQCDGNGNWNGNIGE